MNLLDMLKQANIFSPTGDMSQQQFPVGSIGGPQMDQSQAPPQQPQGMDLSAAIQGMLSPKDEQFQNYAQMIQSMPQRQDYPPDMLHKIGGLLAGMGTGSPVGISNGAVLGYKSDIPTGLAVQSAVKDEKYNEAMNDWAKKLKPQQELSQMESTRNVNQRVGALGELRAKNAADRTAETIAKDRAAEEDRDLERERKTKRDEAYIQGKQWAMSHPNYEARTDKDGRLFYVNKNDPTDIKDSGIDTGKLGDLEKSDLNIKGKLEEIKARGSNATDLEGVKQANRKELEGTKQINRLGLAETNIEGRKSVNAAKPSSAGGMTPSAERTANQNKAVSIINEHPELEKYFIKGGNKIPTGELVPPVGNEQDAGYAIAQRLMGKTGDISLGSTNPQEQIQPQSNRELTRPNTAVEDPKIKAARSKVEAGYVLITDGKSFGQIKPEDSSRLPKGWMVVK